MVRSRSVTGKQDTTRVVGVTETARRAFWAAAAAAVADRMMRTANPEHSFLLGRCYEHFFQELHFDRTAQRLRGRAIKKGLAGADADAGLERLRKHVCARAFALRLQHPTLSGRGLERLLAEDTATRAQKLRGRPYSRGGIRDILKAARIEAVLAPVKEQSGQ